MGGVSIVATVTIGFFGTSLKGLVRLLGFVSALSIGLITAFSLGESAGRMRDAATKLRAAIFTFDADRNQAGAYKELVHQWELAQTIVGNVTFRPPNSGAQAANTSAAKMYAAADLSHSASGTPYDPYLSRMHTVLSSLGKSVVIDVGAEQGAKLNSRFWVVRNGEKIGDLKITSVKPKTSLADVVAGSSVNPGDAVVLIGLPERSGTVEPQIQ